MTRRCRDHPKPRPTRRLVVVCAGEQVGSLHGWNQIELLCIGERVRIVSNGVLVTDWTDPDPSLVAAGPIALQLHKMDPGMVRRPPRLALGFFGHLWASLGFFGLHC